MQARVAIAAALIFAAGFVGGIAFGRYALGPSDSHRQGPPNERPPAPAMFWRRGIVDRMSQDLNLSSEQAAKIDEIIRESQEQMRKLWEPIEPRAKQIVEETQSKIEAVLTPEQREKYQQKIKEAIARRPARRPGPPDAYEHIPRRPSGEERQPPGHFAVPEKGEPRAGPEKHER